MEFNFELSSLLNESLHSVYLTFLDILPIASIIIIFQLLLIRRKIPQLKQLILGIIFVILGLALFLQGLNIAIFPIGKNLSFELLQISKDNAANYYWIYLFAFLIGFSTTIAEPALLAVSLKAHELDKRINAFYLRISVALGVAIGLAIGVFRLITGIAIENFVIAGYLLLLIQTLYTPSYIIPVAYDSGGVTTSTVTVPLVAALGIGLAENIPGRNVIVDGFGLIAFASLFPIMTLMFYAQITDILVRRNNKKLEKFNRLD